MSQEKGRKTTGEEAPRPDFAACCQEMAGAMDGCGPGMERMMSACGPIFERMRALCGEMRPEPEPAAGDTDPAGA